MKNTEFNKHLTSALDEQVNALNSQTIHQLRNAREIALSKQKKGSFSFKWVGGAAAGIAMASVLTFIITPKLMPTNTISPLEDLEILTAEADLDLVTQLDFYQWIDESALSDITL